jgi:hypothetical protein
MEQNSREPVHAMKILNGEVQLHSVQTSARDGDEWPDSCPCRFNSVARTSSTHWIGGWMSPGADLESNLGSSSLKNWYLLDIEYKCLLLTN